MNIVSTKSKINISYDVSLSILVGIIISLTLTDFSENKKNLSRKRISYFKTLNGN